MGGLFGPQFLAKLAGHPKFGPKLSDPAFMMKLNMVQSNPQLLMSDPELMEVFQVLIGGGAGDGPMGGDDDYPGDSPSSFTPPKSYAPPPKVPEPVEEVSEEEAAKRYAYPHIHI